MLLPKPTPPHFVPDSKYTIYYTLSYNDDEVFTELAKLFSEKKVPFEAVYCVLEDSKWWIDFPLKVNFVDIPGTPFVLSRISGTSFSGNDILEKVKEEINSNF